MIWSTSTITSGLNRSKLNCTGAGICAVSGTCREFGHDPDGAKVRFVSVVERYKQ